MAKKNMQKQFKLYAPSTHKSYDLNEDGTLTIEGIASTTNEDLEGDVVLQSAIESMKQQLLTSTKNLHGDHLYSLFEGVIGVITEVLDSDENSLKIKAVIRSKFASEIKEMLDIGIQLGLSIGGQIKDYNPISNGGWEIKDINLLEISLTAMPANWDTYSTVRTTKGVVEAKCLTGACQLIRKTIEEENMSTEVIKEQSEETTFTKDDAVDLFNELMASKQEEITQTVVDQVSSELDKKIDEKINALKEELKPAEEETPAEKEVPDEEEEDKEDEEKTKSIIQNTIREEMSHLFKSLSKTRDPTFKVDEVKEKEVISSGQEEEVGLTSKQIAEELFKNQTKEDLIQSLLK